MRIRRPSTDHGSARGFIRFAVGDVLGVIDLPRPPDLVPVAREVCRLSAVRSLPDSPPRVPCPSCGPGLLEDGKPRLAATPHPGAHIRGGGKRGNSQSAIFDSDLNSPGLSVGWASGAIGSPGQTLM